VWPVRRSDFRRTPRPGFRPPSTGTPHSAGGLRVPTSAGVRPGPGLPGRTMGPAGRRDRRAMRRRVPVRQAWGTSPGGACGPVGCRRLSRGTATTGAVGVPVSPGRPLRAPAPVGVRRIGRDRLDRATATTGAVGVPVSPGRPLRAPAPVGMRRIGRDRLNRATATTGAVGVPVSPGRPLRAPAPVGVRRIGCGRRPLPMAPASCPVRATDRGHRHAGRPTAVSGPVAAWAGLPVRHVQGASPWRARVHAWPRPAEPGDRHYRHPAHPRPPVAGPCTSRPTTANGLLAAWAGPPPVTHRKPRPITRACSPAPAG
jgi:ribosome modulation factor